MTPALTLANKGRIYPTPNEKVMFKAILMSFAHYENKSLTQGQIVQYVQKTTNVKTRQSIEKAILLLTVGNYFKLFQKGRARITFLLKKGTRHLEYIQKKAHSSAT